MDLRAELEAITDGPLGLVGLGAVEQGDDGLGVRLAEAVQERFAEAPVGRSAVAGSILIAGVAPERVLAGVARRGFGGVLFLDAVDFGGQPGSVVLLDAAEMQARFPQISTHRISLGLWAKWLEAEGPARVWLLGVQPESLRPGAGLSPRVDAAVQWLADVLAQLLRRRAAAGAESGGRSAFVPAEVENGLGALLC